MRLQVSLTVGDQTHQAGLQGFELVLRTDITGDFMWFSRFLPGHSMCFSRSLVWCGSLFQLPWLPQLISPLSDIIIKREYLSGSEGCVTYATFTLVISVPVLIDTGAAVVVSAWSGDWISEHIITHRTDQLLFRHNAGSGLHLCTLGIKVREA